MKRVVVMFFFVFFGIKDKEILLGNSNDIICPQCGEVTNGEVYKTYSYFHLFLIPLVKWNRRYFVKTNCCKRVYMLNPEVGKQFEKDSNIVINKGDLEIIEVYTHMKYCDHCRVNVPNEYQYCPYCGKDLRD